MFLLLILFQLLFVVTIMVSVATLTVATLLVVLTPKVTLAEILFTVVLLLVTLLMVSPFVLLAATMLVVSLLVLVTMLVVSPVVPVVMTVSVVSSVDPFVVAMLVVPLVILVLVAVLRFRTLNLMATRADALVAVLVTVFALLVVLALGMIAVVVPLLTVHNASGDSRVRLSTLLKQYVWPCPNHRIHLQIPAVSLWPVPWLSTLPQLAPVATVMQRVMFLLTVPSRKELAMLPLALPVSAKPLLLRSRTVPLLTRVVMTCLRTWIFRKPAIGLSSHW